MPEALIKPTSENHIFTQIPVKNLDQTESLIDIFLKFDSILPSPDGRFKIIVKWNVTEKTETVDEVTLIKYLYQEAWIKWSPSSTYLKDGIEIPLGTLNEDGTTYTTTEEVLEYITANASEIAGYAMKTRTIYVG